MNRRHPALDLDEEGRCPVATATEGPRSHGGSDALDQAGRADSTPDAAPREAHGEPGGPRRPSGLADRRGGVPLDEAARRSAGWSGLAAPAWWQAARRRLAATGESPRPPHRLGPWFGLPWRTAGAARSSVPLAADSGWVVDTPAVGLPAIPAIPEPVRAAAPWQHPRPARPPASAVVGASARRLPVRPALPPADPEIAAGGVVPADPEPLPRDTGRPRWRLAALGVLWLALVVGALVGLTLRLADIAAFVTLLGFAALALLTGRPAGAGRARDRGLVAVWTLPVALLLPPIYPLVVHLPLCLVRAWRGSRPGQAPAPAGRPVVSRGGPGERGSISGRQVQDAVALGAAGAAASWLHGYLVPSHGLYTAHDLTGSPARLAGLAAAAVGFALVRGLLLPGPARRLWSRGERPRTALPQGSVPAAALALLGLTELCSAVAVAVLWATNPLLMLVALPPALLLARSLPPDELLAAARTDPKTGLANVTWWREVADAELVRARRAGRPLSVLLVDIDHFKQVNDQHGHLFGDTVLVAVAGALRAATRPWDLVGRFGGEEFVVLLAEVDQVTAAEIAERIRRQVAATRCPLAPASPGGAAVSVTVSVGAAVCGPSAGLAETLEAADAALYRAKAAGRNRIQVAPPATRTGPGEPPVRVGEPPVRVAETAVRVAETGGRLGEAPVRMGEPPVRVVDETPVRVVDAVPLQTAQPD